MVKGNYLIKSFGSKYKSKYKDLGLKRGVPTTVAT